MWWLGTVTILVGRGWWVYSSDTLLWSPIFYFLSFSLHHRSSNTHHANTTFHDICANLHTITIDYILYPSHHWPSTTSKTSHMTYGPHCFIFLSYFLVYYPTCPVMGWPITSHHTTQSGPSPSIFHTWTLCSFYLSFVFKTFVSTLKKKEVFPQNSDLSWFRPIISPCSILHLHPHSHFQLSLHCSKPVFCSTSHSMIQHQETIPCSQTTPLRAT